MNLQTTMTAIAAAVSTAEAVIEAIKPLYQFVGEMMDVCEQAYAGVENAGGTKKAAVLAAAEQFFQALGGKWDTVSGLVSGFIDTVKAAYNKIAVALSHQKAAAAPAAA